MVHATYACMCHYTQTLMSVHPLPVTTPVLTLLVALPAFAEMDMN